MSRYAAEEKFGVWVVRDLRGPYRTLVTHQVTDQALTFPDEPSARAWIQREHDRDQQLLTRRAVGETAP